METADLVEAVAGTVADRYVDAGPAAEAAAWLRQRAAEGAFSDLDGPDLTNALTRELRARIPDKHLQVRWSDRPRDPSATSDWDNPEYLAAYWREQDSFNQGVVKAERLAGNVGLMELRSIDEPEGTGHVLEAALALLARCDALIIDVRVSNGGAPSGVAFLVSHFVEPPARKLLDVVGRDGTVMEQTWTSPYVRAARFVTQPLFVLVGARTPSGTEELAYDLQYLGRATIVGETTVGAANPVEQYVVAPHVVVRVPLCRVRNAITGSNWEGVGVVPHLPCPAGQALEVAHREAARRLLAAPGAADVPEELRAELTTVLALPEEGRS
jgi:C-terminal processing protease CtpA/Prc